VKYYVKTLCQSWQRNVEIKDYFVDDTE